MPPAIPTSAAAIGPAMRGLASRRQAWKGRTVVCSDRCRLIDLGKWASGGYVI